MIDEIRSPYEAGIPPLKSVTDVTHQFQCVVCAQNQIECCVYIIKIGHTINELLIFRLPHDPVGIRRTATDQECAFLFLREWSFKRKPAVNQANSAIKPNSFGVPFFELNIHDRRNTLAV